MNGALVSSVWLHENLSDPDLIILDARLKANKTGVISDDNIIRIPGARFFDITTRFSDIDSSFPNTLLSPEEFEVRCSEIGICKTSKIVVYDNLGVYSSPRVWWMFKVMGFDAIAILNGELPNWISEGYLVERYQSIEFEHGDFEARLQPELVKNFQCVKANIQTQEALLIDARSADRFNGVVPEPRKGLRGGNISNSINIPYQEVLNNGKFKSKGALIKLFNGFEIKNKPLIFSCGSGITACIVMFAANLVLDNKTAVYDGSWTEWAQLDY